MAGSLIGTGRIDFLGNNAQFKKAVAENINAMNKQSRALWKHQQRMRQFNRTVKRAVGNVKALAIGLATYAIGRGIKSTTEFGAAIYEASTRIGIAAEQLQLWQRAVAGEGGTAEGTVKSLQKFTKAIYESRIEIEKGTFKTGMYSEAFRRLGITMDEIQNLSIDELMLRVADGMTNLADQTERNAVGMELFGTRGAAMVNVLQNGRRAVESSLSSFRELGVITTEQSRILKALDQDFADFRTAITAAFQVAIAENADNLRIIMGRLLDAARSLGDVFRFLNDNVFPRFRSYMIGLGIALSTSVVAGFVAAGIAAGGFTLKLVALRVALIKTGIGAIAVIAGELIYQFTKLTEKTGGFKNAMIIVGEAIIQTISKGRLLFSSLFFKVDQIFNDIRAVIANKMADSIESVRDFIIYNIEAYNGLISGIEKAFDGFNLFDLILGKSDFDFAGFGERFAEGFEKGFTSKSNAAAAIYDLPLEKMLELRVRAAEWEEEALKSAGLSAKQFSKALEAYKFTQFVTDPTYLPTDRLADSLGTGVTRDRNLGGDGDGNLETITPELQKIDRAIGRINEENSKWQDANDSIAKGIADFVENGLRGFQSLEAMAVQVANSIRDAFYKAFITRPIEQGINKFLDGLNWNRVATFFGGGRADYPRRAMGGPAYGPTWVGENGKELVDFQTPAYVYSHGESMRMAADSGINLTFAPVINSGDPEMMRTEIQKALPEYVAVSEAVLTKHARRPGRFRAATGGR